MHLSLCLTSNISRYFRCNNSCDRIAFWATAQNMIVALGYKCEWVYWQWTWLRVARKCFSSVSYYCGSRKTEISNCEAHASHKLLDFISFAFQQKTYLLLFHVHTFHTNQPSNIGRLTLLKNFYYQGVLYICQQVPQVSQSTCL